MQLHDNTDNEIVTKTVMILLAVGLNCLELLIPRIPLFPWFKPGFANIITIIWIIRFGTIDAVLYTILRSWISGFYFGFSLITLTLSVSGGIAATIAVGMLWKILGKNQILGSVGLAISGAIMHNSAQLLVVYLLFMRNDSVFYQIPIMMIASFVFGGLTGIMVPYVKDVLDSRICDVKLRDSTAITKMVVRKTDIIASLLVLSCCGCLFLVEKISIVLLAAGLFSIAAFFAERRQIRIFIYPLRFKYLFLLIFLTYALFTGGKRVLFLPFGTEEGFYSATIQMLRLWAWIEAGVVLNRFRCNSLLYLLLSEIFPGNKRTLSAGFDALLYFPEMLSKRYKGSANSGRIVKKPGNVLKAYLAELFNKIEQVIAS
ncbi:MAG TPA: Gx transporter family protein [Chitinispirillaceae bacterium]|nr:Gx transporter family protein [Chitinispirillaceae bacterium]